MASDVNRTQNSNAKYVALQATQSQNEKWTRCKMFVNPRKGRWVFPVTLYDVPERWPNPAGWLLGNGKNKRYWKKTVQSNEKTEEKTK